MAKQKQTNDIQAKQQHHKKHNLDTIIKKPEKLTNLEKLSHSLARSTAGDSSQLHSTLLNNASIQTRQRQKIAAQIQKVGGNQYLQRVILQRQANETSLTTPSQRQRFGPRVAQTRTHRSDHSELAFEKSASKLVMRQAAAGTRQTKSTEKKGPTFEEAVATLDAIGAIISVPKMYSHSVEVREGLGYKVGFPAAYAAKVPARYMSLLKWWYQIAHGGSKPKDGPHVIIEGSMLREHIQMAHQKTRPLVKVILTEGDEQARPWIEEIYYSEIRNLTRRAYEEEASAAVSEAGAKLSALLSPEQQAQEKQIQSGLATAIAVLSDLSGQVNNFAPGDLDAAYEKIMAQHELGGPLAQNLKGMGPKLTIAHLNDVLGGLKAVMDLSDPEARKKMFDKKLGKWGYVKGGADLMGNVGSVLQGAISGLAGVTAATATIAGHADMAAKILAYASKATGALGKALAVLSIVKGGIALFHPDSSVEERASGAADIAAGVGALIGGSVGAGLSAAALSFKINLSILEAAVDMSRSLISIELRQCYERMAQSGKELAIYANRALAGQRLGEIEKDATKQAYLMKEVNHSISLLRSELRTLIQASQGEGGITDPGTYKPLRDRFAKAGAPPTDKTSVAELVEHARVVINIIEQAFADYKTVLNETTIDAWKQHG